MIEKNINFGWLSSGKLVAPKEDNIHKINAQKFETAFYSNPDMRPVERSLQGEGDSVPNPDVMMKQLESSPQAMDAFTRKFIEQYGDQIMTQLAKKMLGA